MILHLCLSRNLASQTGSFVFFAKRILKQVWNVQLDPPKAPIGSGYKSLAEHLIQFQMHGCMRLDIDIKRLDNGDGIEATMMRHHAC